MESECLIPQTIVVVGRCSSIVVNMSAPNIQMQKTRAEHTCSVNESQPASDLKRYCFS